jgi:hypothetical protein
MRVTLMAMVAVMTIGIAGTTGASAAPANASMISAQAKATSPVIDVRMCKVHRWCERGRCWVHRHCW